MSWVAQFTRSGELMEEKGRERVEGGRVTDPMTATLSIRHSAQAAAITASWRCVIKGVVWNIRSVSNPDRRNRRLEMVIERGVAT